MSIMQIGFILNHPLKGSLELKIKLCSSSLIICFFIANVFGL